MTRPYESFNVTLQGFGFHSGLGLVFVPEDKAQRALRQLAAAADGRVTLQEYHSLFGLLQSMLFVMGMRRAATYGLYAPLSGRLYLEPEELAKITPSIVATLRQWSERLVRCAGVPFSAAVHLPGPDSSLLLSAPAVFFLRSDASKEGARIPALGGVLGGSYWHFPLDTPHMQLPIAVLEFVAAVATYAVFAEPLPSGALFLLEVDALATAQALASDAARSPLMQYVHRFFMALPSYEKHHHRLLCVHIFGEANVAADAASRGDFDTLRALFSQLGLAPLRVDSPAWVPCLLVSLLSLQRGEDVPLPACHTTASTALGVFNPSMWQVPLSLTIGRSDGGSPPRLSLRPHQQRRLFRRCPPPPSRHPPSRIPTPSFTPLHFPSTHTTCFLLLELLQLPWPPPPRCRTPFSTSSKATPPPLPSAPPLFSSALWWATCLTPLPRSRILPLVPRLPRGAIGRLGARSITCRLGAFAGRLQTPTSIARPCSKPASCASSTSASQPIRATAGARRSRPARTRRCAMSAACILIAIRLWCRLISSRCRFAASIENTPASILSPILSRAERSPSPESCL